MQVELERLYGPLKLYGPYVRKSDGRKIVTIHFEGKKKTSLLARFLLEIKLKRRLTSGEEVDHLDGDPLNDCPDNLTVTDGVTNKRKAIKQAGRSVTYEIFFCARCNAEVQRRPAYMSKRGGLRVFCSNACRAGFYKKSF